MTVLENLQMGAGVDRRRRISSDDLDQRLRAVPAAARSACHQRGGTLSGGEQQMLAIGRALMSRPRLLLLDEPSLGLAPLLVQQIFGAIRELNERDGLTVFLVEQNAYHALKLAHRGYVMVNGEITLTGTGTELLARPEIRAAYLEGGARSMARGYRSDRLYAGEAIGAVLLVTGFLGCGAAWLSGRAIAATWRPSWKVALAMVPLAAAARFIHFALFEGNLLSLLAIGSDLCLFLIVGLLAWRATRATQMVRQYPWLYARTGPLTLARNRAGKLVRQC